jgi:hypothetical protein
MLRRTQPLPYPTHGRAVTATIRPACMHCGKPVNGFGVTADGSLVCHTGMLPVGAEPADCYRLVTIYGHKSNGSCCAEKEG